MQNSDDELRSRLTKWLVGMAIGLLVLILLFILVLVAGCTEEQKTQALDAVSPIIVLKGSTQYYKMYPTSTQTTEPITPPPTITPPITVTTVPTLAVHSVDPFDGGERWEGQWFRWTWYNVSGLQTADRGIVVYRHLYMDGFTYWDDAWGQYIQTAASPGMRFLAVYVHEEDFSPDNSGLWGYDNSTFHLQYNGVFHDQYSYNNVYRISELEDSHYDYYKIDRAIPFGIKRVYGGMIDAKTGGYHIEEQYSLWSGKGNSWDGYLLYEVPKSLTDADFYIVGHWANKDVYWRFDIDSGMKYPVSETGVPTHQIIPVVTTEGVRA